MKLLLATLLLTSSAHAMASLRPDFSPTADQIAQCAPDAVRLCSQEIQTGDRNLIAQCMVRAERRHRLSAGCRAVIR